MTTKTDGQERETFETAVIKRMKESGFLEVEVRTECLVRSGDDYQDELINYGWWAWQAGRAALQEQPAMQADAGYDIEAAAQALAECMDYPWEHMPTEGRIRMREHAKLILDEARRRIEGEGE